MKTTGLLCMIFFSLVAASCGGGGVDGPMITTLDWNVDVTHVVAPTAGSVTAGQTVLYKFIFPNDSSGDPSAQIVVTSGNIDAYLCNTFACGPGFPSLNSNLGMTTGGQVYVSSPGMVTVYYVAIYGRMASGYTIQATGT